MPHLAAGRSDAVVEICFLHIIVIKRDIPLQHQQRWWQNHSYHHQLHHRKSICILHTLVHGTEAFVYKILSASPLHSTLFSCFLSPYGSYQFLALNNSNNSSTRATSCGFGVYKVVKTIFTMVLNSRLVSDKDEMQQMQFQECGHNEIWVRTECKRARHSMGMK